MPGNTEFAKDFVICEANYCIGVLQKVKKIEYNKSVLLLNQFNFSGNIL